MRFTIPNISTNPAVALRRAGYVFQHYTSDNEMSFVRIMGSNGFPRFHMYVKLNGRDLQISFHIDQKKYTYGDDTRHHGEYEESPALEQEAVRVKGLVK